MERAALFGHRSEARYVATGRPPRWTGDRRIHRPRNAHGDVGPPAAWVYETPERATDHPHQLRPDRPARDSHIHVEPGSSASGRRPIRVNHEVVAPSGCVSDQVNLLLGRHTAAPAGPELVVGDQHPRGYPIPGVSSFAQTPFRCHRTTAVLEQAVQHLSMLVHRPPPEAAAAVDLLRRLHPGATCPPDAAACAAGVRRRTSARTSSSTAGSFRR